LLQATRFVAYFEEDIPKDIMFPECGGDGNLDLEEYCKSFRYKCSVTRVFAKKQVLEMVTQHLLQTYFKLKQIWLMMELMDKQCPNLK
jgi:hypothetical protein